MSSLLTGLLAGYAIAMPPGAVSSLIIRTGLPRGFALALAAGWGAASVDFAYCSVAVLAGAAVVPLLGAVDLPLRVATGIVLIGLGLRGMLRARTDAPVATGAPDRGDLLRTYLRFVGITAVNPATLAYFAAVALGFAGAVLQDAFAFVAGVFLASASWHLVLATFSGALHGRLGPRARLGLALVANGVVVALGLRILLQLAGWWR